MKTWECPTCTTRYDAYEVAGSDGALSTTPMRRVDRECAGAGCYEGLCLECATAERAQTCEYCEALLCLGCAVACACGCECHYCEPHHAAHLAEQDRDTPEALAADVEQRVAEAEAKANQGWAERMGAVFGGFARTTWRGQIKRGERAI